MCLWVLPDTNARGRGSLLSSKVQHARELRMKRELRRAVTCIDRVPLEKEEATKGTSASVVVVAATIGVFAAVMAVAVTASSKASANG